MSVRESVENAYKWFIEIIGNSLWESRRKLLIESLHKAQEDSESSSLLEETKSVSSPRDRFGWYLYLIEAELHHPQSGDAFQLSRIFPWFEAIGRDLSAISQIPGIDKKRRELFAKPSQADSILFEILVAACYVRNGWEVEITPEKSARVTDLVARRAGEQLYVACRRLSKDTGYAETERQSWLRKWKAALAMLEPTKASIHFEVIFKNELISIPNDAISRTLIHYARNGFMNSGTFINRPGFSVCAHSIDMREVDFRLYKRPVKPNSPEMLKLLSGDYQWWCGYTNKLTPSERREAGNLGIYPPSVQFAGLQRAISAKWQCLADSSIDKKTNDVHKRATEAAKQIPEHCQGVIHIGYERIDGEEIEAKRISRIGKTLAKFSSPKNDIKGIVCHAIATYAEVGELKCSESVHPFMLGGPAEALEPILAQPSLLNPEPAAA